MSNESILADLLVQWDDLLELGTPVSAEELCRDYPELAPELARRIRVLQRWQQARDGLDLIRLPNDSSAKASAGPPLPCIPGYETLCKLGQGGMGVVYKARHLKQDRLVALKVISTDRASDPESVKRFGREARVLLSMDHVNVVRAVEVGEANGAHFLAIEFIDGIDAAAYLRQGKTMTIAATCEVIRQVALGLQYAHEQGLVHRDIKPSNLMFERQPEGNPNAFPVVKILDLGLVRRDSATVEDVSSTLTKYGAVLGTPDYMPPEQFADAKNADARADIYSLGCTMYHLLTGKVPFPGSNLGQILVKHLTQQPQPLADLRPEIPPKVVHLVGRMMAKEPQQRPDAVEVAQELASLLQSGDLDASSPLAALVGDDGITRTLREHREEPVRWRRLLLAASAALASLTLAVVAVLCLARDPVDNGLRAVPDASGLREGGSVLDRLRHDDLTAEQKVGWVTEENKWPHRALVAVLGGTPGRQWDSVTALAVSPDGKRIATGGAYTNVVSVWDAATLKRVAWLRAELGVAALGFLPDNQTLLISAWDQSGHFVLSWRAETGSEAKRVAGVACDAFSPDGTRGLRVYGKEETALIDVSQGTTLWPKEKFRREDAVVRHYGSAFSPDGKQALVTGRKQGEVLRLDAHTGTEINTYANICPAWAQCLAFLDGERFLVGGDAGVYLVDPANAAKLATQIDARPSRFKNTMATGNYAVWVDGQNKKARIWGLNGKPIRDISISSSQIASCRLLGERLIIGEDTGGVRIWDIKSGTELLPSKYTCGLNGVAFSPDGSRVTVAGYAGLFQSWDVVSGQSRGPVEVGGWILWSLCHAPDGSLLCADHGRRLIKVDGATDAVFGSIPFDGNTNLTPLAVSCSAKGRAFVSFGQRDRPIRPNAENATVAFEDTKEVARFVGHKGTLVANALSADGKLLLTASQDSPLANEQDVRLWDADSGKQLHGWKSGGKVFRVAISPQVPPTWAVSGNVNSFSYYDLEHERGTSAWTESLWEGYIFVAITPDERILTVSKKGYVRIWTRWREKVAEARWPGLIDAMALAPDGKHFATANADGSVYVVRLPGK